MGSLVSDDCYVLSLEYLVFLCSGIMPVVATKLYGLADHEAQEAPTIIRRSAPPHIKKLFRTDWCTGIPVWTPVYLERSRKKLNSQLNP